MLSVLRNTWALLGGLLLLMIGNGMQGTLLGIRGVIEGFSSFALSIVMAGYFLGFLFAARATPWMIGRVGHVRVFAALASIISACFVLFPTFPDEIAWVILRVIVGFCFCGVYVVSESWLNGSTDNATRGKALSAYMIVQLVGVTVAQALINLTPPDGWYPFVTISVLVSISFAPILLSMSPAPAFGETRRMSLRQLYRASPLGVVAIFALGMVYSASFGMAAVFGSAMGMSVAQISLFVGAIYVGALITQYPLGWLSDRMDRRMLIVIVCLTGALACVLGASGGGFGLMVAAALLFGGMSMPLYALVLAYTNDHLDPQDMAAASGGLLFANGVGAVAAAPILGAAMDLAGPWMFFALNGAVLAGIALYAVWRMTRRPAPDPAEATPYAPVLPQATPVALEVLSEVAEQRAVAEGEGARQGDEGAVAPAAARSDG